MKMKKLLQSQEVPGRLFGFGAEEGDLEMQGSSSRKIARIFSVLNMMMNFLFWCHEFPVSDISNSLILVSERDNKMFNLEGK